MIFTDNRLYNILSLQTAFGVGSHKAYSIYLNICDAGLLDSTFDSILTAGFLDDKSALKLKSVESAKIYDTVKICKDNDIMILPVYSYSFPESLKNIYSPPLVLYVKGDFPDVNSQPLFCIVGPRKATEFGRKAAYALARRLASAGMIIVSGSANGCDLSAHSGVLSASGKSVMVAADGILTQIKSKNHCICEKILQSGCIVSECPPNAVAGKYSFPVRNRLMAGLSLGVAVIEAPQKSGSLITAGYALEQGKDVFVIPGNPVDPAYKGSNSLLRDGALPLLDASDIFLKYIADYPEKINIEKAYATASRERNKKSGNKTESNALSDAARMVYNNLSKPVFTADDLLGLDIDATTILSVITELEIEGYIASMPGGSYRIKEKREF